MVSVRVRVVSLRDSFSVLLRPQHLSMLKTDGRVHTSYYLSVPCILRVSLRHSGINVLMTNSPSEISVDRDVFFYTLHILSGGHLSA